MPSSILTALSTLPAWRRLDHLRRRRRKPGDPPPLILEDFVITQGQIDFTDRRQSKPATIEFKPLQLAIKHFTTLRGQEGPKTITASTADGETMRWTGNIGLNPVRSKGQFAFENFRTATLWKFARDAVNLDPPAGKLTATADYNVDLSGPEPEVVFSNLALALTGLALKLQGADAPFLELPDARISGVRFDLAKQDVEVGKIVVKGGHARLVVDESGELNMQRVAKESAAPAAASQKPASAAPRQPWKVKLNEFDFGEFAVDYQDTSRTPGLKAGVGSIKVGLKAEAEAGADKTKALVSDIAVGVSDFHAGFSDSGRAAGSNREVRPRRRRLRSGCQCLDP